jgi:hypothetical protein
MIMSVTNNVPSPPDMASSKYDPRLAPKKPKPRPKPVKKAELEVEVATAKNGGYVKAADGCVKKGRTRGTMVKM